MVRVVESSSSVQIACQDVRMRLGMNHAGTCIMIEQVHLLKSPCQRIESQASVSSMRAAPDNIADLVALEP